MKKSIVSGVAGCVRVHPLTLAELDKQEKHGKRLDTTSQARRINDEEPVTTTGLDLGELYAKHIDGAFVPRARTKVLHVLVQFPRDLVDLNDAEGLLRHTRKFAEGVWGDQAIFADRYDLDEKSKGVGDLFIAPKYLKTTKRDPKGRLAVSMTRHNKLLAKKHGRKPTQVWEVGKALQDELYEYLRDVMGLKGVQRGSPKLFAGPDHKLSEQLRVEELEEEDRRLEQVAADLQVRADDLDRREAAIKAREDEVALKQSDLNSRESELEVEAKRDRAAAAVETAQAKLLLRAADDGEGLDLTIQESGKPKMNEAAMDVSERLAYRSTWSERMLELARFVARTLQVMREKVAAVVRREKMAKEREDAARSAQLTAKEQVEAASAAQYQVQQAKVLAETFMTAWQRVPEGQRSPPVHEAMTAAEALLAGKKPTLADQETVGRPKSIIDGAAALRSLSRGPNDARTDHLRGTGRDGASR